MDIKELIYTPLSGEEMLNYNPDSRLYKYTDLYDYNDIDDVFNHFNKIILLYLTTSFNNGHWVCLFRNGDKISFFDSYGYNVDDEEQFIKDPELRAEFGEDYKYLLDLLKKSNYSIDYNPYKLQGKYTYTCGRYVSLRLLNKHLNNEDFINRFFSTKENPDITVCKLIN